MFPDCPVDVPLTRAISRRRLYSVTLLQPIALLAIIIAGYLFERCSCRPARFRIIQVMLFDLVLPGAIVYSFATNPHDPSLLWLSAFGFVALVPVLVIFSATRHSPVTQRAFLMLNATGLNIGCFCFPVVQAFLGEQAMSPRRHVRHWQLHHGGRRHQCDDADAPAHSTGPSPHRARRRRRSTLPYTRPAERCQASRPAFAAAHGAQGFCGFHSVRHVCDHDRAHGLRTVAAAWFADLFRPLSNANACVAMLMVGMMMDLPANRSDTFAVLKVLAWSSLRIGVRRRGFVPACRSTPAFARRR